MSAKELDMKDNDTMTQKRQAVLCNERKLVRMLWSNTGITVAPVHHKLENTETLVLPCKV